MTGLNEYDRVWTAQVGTTVRRRTGLSTDRGSVTQFVVQLEYRHDGEWRPVVRYDHDGHDVNEEGLHIDIYRHGEKHATEYITAPLPAGVALDAAEDHLAENLERFLKRYERWHEIRRESQ